MKQITIECFESGYSKLNTSDLHFKSESVATQIKVIFPENTLLYKWLDLKFGNNEERRYFLGDNQIETLDLTRDETIVGRLEITPFATNEIEAFAYKVAYDPKEVVIKNIVDATESVIEVPKEDIILATIEQYIDYIKQEMEMLLVKRLEFDKDTNKLSAILNDESEISVILQRQDILDIISGNTIVGKAYADELGNIIKDHYAKKTDLFDKDYNELINKPDLFSGSYNDLSNKPTLFDGKYSSLIGKPTKLSDFENDENFIDLQTLTQEKTILETKIKELERELREVSDDREIITDAGYDLVVKPNGVGNVKVGLKITGKNLAMPNLMGKTYLGDGWYLIWGNEIDFIKYNTLTGVYWYNGNINIVETDDQYNLINILGDFRYSAYYISGTFEGSQYNLNYFNFNNVDVLGIRDFKYDNKSILREDGILRPYFNVRGKTFNNYKYKTQIEKGDTATSYEAPYYEHLKPTANYRVAVRDRGVNLAMPDLTGKEYLGDGVYLVFKRKQLELTYNVYSGNFVLNGSDSVNTDIALGRVWNYSNQAVKSFEYVSGSYTGETYFVFGQYFNHQLLDFTNKQNIINDLDNISDFNKTILRFYYHANSTYDNYTFKIQLEKGSTATPYEVPYIQGYNERPLYSSLYIKSNEFIEPDSELKYVDGNYMIGDTIVDTSGVLKALPNKKLELTKHTNQVVVYGVGFGRVTHDIKSIEKIVILRLDGTQEVLDSDLATFTNKDFTHINLTNGDLVYIVYEIDREEQLPQLNVEYYNSNNILISPNGTAYRKKEVVDNSGVITITGEPI